MNSDLKNKNKNEDLVEKYITTRESLDDSKKAALQKKRKETERELELLTLKLPTTKKAKTTDTCFSTPVEGTETELPDGHVVNMTPHDIFVSQWKAFKELDDALVECLVQNRSVMMQPFSQYTCDEKKGNGKQIYGQFRDHADSYYDAKAAEITTLGFNPYPGANGGRE